MRFGSICSGIEAASVAWNPLGWEAAWFSEIEPFPCALLAHHYPNVPNLGDMTTIAPRILSGEVEAPDILCGGTPCFLGDHLVLTETGYIPIRNVQVGMKVMTHEGRLRRVLRTGFKSAQYGFFTAVGHRPIACTPNHPFLSVYYKTWIGGSGRRQTVFSDTVWTPAEQMEGRQWCSLLEYDEIPCEFDSAKLAGAPSLLMRLAGMYVGDGWIRRFKGKNKKTVMLGLNRRKLEIYHDVFGNLGEYEVTEGGVTKVAISDTRLADWLVKNFGEHAHAKRIPAWVLASPYKHDFLRGYIDTDGCVLANGVSFTTVSSALAFGIADLCNADGYVASVKFVPVKKTTAIEGRIVNQRDQWQVRAFHQACSRKSRELNGYLCRLAKSYVKTQYVGIVYNLEVEEDNSYILEGAVVHNCQAFSVAGLRKSLDDARGNLSLVFCELANAIDTARLVRRLPPSIIFWENVPGVLNTKDNAFGCFLAGLAQCDVPLEVPGGKWGGAGYVLTGKRAVAWRTLDAQYFGVPQRRRRVFVVASARDGFDPCQVLFERAGVQRNPAPVGTPGKAPAVFAEGSFGAFRASGVASTCKASGGCLGGGPENLVLSNGFDVSPTIDASIYSKNNQQDNSKYVINDSLLNPNARR